MTRTDITVITVTWNSKELIDRQLQSVLAAAGDLHIQQIIVDNASTDGTPAHILGKHPEVLVLANNYNAGFGAANNQALEHAKGDWLLFFNPDMQLKPGSLPILLDWMIKHPKVGIASPTLVDEHGNLNEAATPRRFPQFFEQLTMILKLHHVFPKLLDKYHMKGVDFTLEHSVDSVRGAFMLMRKEIVQELGWAWDPRYFIWYEDVDICRETRRLGYDVVYTPIIEAIDYVGQSFKQRTTLWKQQQFTKSMVTYFKKWEPWYKWMPLAVARPIGIALAWIADKLHARKK